MAIEPATMIVKTTIPTEEISENAKRQKSQVNSGVHIFGLRKQFGEKTAVDGLHLSMYQ